MKFKFLELLIIYLHKILLICLINKFQNLLKTINNSIYLKIKIQTMNLKKLG